MRRHRRGTRAQRQNRYHASRCRARHRQIDARARICLARRRGDRYSGVWWFRAEKAKDSAIWDGLEQGLVDLRAVLYPGLEPPKERAKAARDVLNFLGSGGFEKPWLLVYDNADDQDVLDAWAPDEAVRYLREASGRNDINDAELMHIANELGRLPLALSHAAAYLRRNRAVTADTYLAEFSRYMREVPKGAAYKTPVFATFQLAMEQAEAEAPGAWAVLSLSAFFAPSKIPEELFKQAPKFYPPKLQPIVTNEARLAEAISILDHLSLADFDPDERTFSVHCLVQAAARGALGNPEAKAEWIAVAVNACVAAYPGGDFRHWAAYERLLTHARTLVELAGDSIGSPLAELLSQAGAYLMSRSVYEEAKPLLKRALAIREKALRPDDPDVTISLNNLASFYRAQGAYEHARPLHGHALAIWEKALGPDHPDVAIALNGIVKLTNFG